ncbi:MAG: lipocalin [Paracoccaceae bacterium]
MLASCGTSARDGYRDRTAPFGATTRFDPQQMTGDWWIRAEFAEEATMQRQVTYALYGSEAFAIGPKNGRLERHDLGEGARWQAGPDGPEVWLLWVDTGYRTAALGTPNGQFGLILDRSPSGGADRITAASEILEWFGYDMSKLQETR